VENDFYVLVLKNETETEFQLEKVKIDKGRETETFIEVLNTEVLKDKKILIKGTYMLQNDDGGS
jgi:cobalt-zinc-cadmium efflux system membrane fusion protein